MSDEGIYRSSAQTQGVRVDVAARYIPEHSRPEQGEHLFAYQITIANVGEVAAQLVTRRWVITDGDGQVQEVQGPGVVGQTPRLEPGQAFVYTSFCPLKTPVGSMCGTYQMVRDDGSGFDAEIAPFTLAMPHAIN